MRRILTILLVGLISSLGIGGLRVMIEPQEACDSDAKWRVDGGAWCSGGYIETTLSIGLHTVEYLNIDNWKTPIGQTVQVNTDQTTIVTGQYFNIADVNSDNRVDLSDYSGISRYWCLSDCVDWNGCEQADINGSGTVDMDDIVLLGERWLANYYIVPSDMTFISAGTFQMGDSFTEDDTDERPVHVVTLSSFYIGKYEITNGQYCQYLNAALSQGLISVIGGTVYQAGSGTSCPYCDTSASSPDSQIVYSGAGFAIRTKDGRDMSNDPMVKISWYGAAAYCNWRSLLENREPYYNLSTWECDFAKKGYHLPTEAQWEYAARGGLSGQRFPWGGNDIDQTLANYRGYPNYFSYDKSPKRIYHPVWSADGISPYTAPVGSFSANEFGLYDMAGNVREWCNDWYFSYSSDSQINPTGPATGSNRVIRDGGWNNYADKCRVASRLFSSSLSRSEGLGFRLALE